MKTNNFTTNNFKRKGEKHMKTNNRTTNNFKKEESLQELLADVYEQTDVKILVKQIQLCGGVDFNRFNKVYTGFVKKKRQRLLKDISNINMNRIDSAFTEYLREHWGARLSDEGLPVATQMELAVKQTYYAFLNADNAFEQRAFTLFLKKKMEKMAEKGADCSEIEACLEDHRKNFTYEKYIEYIYTPVKVCFLELWLEFFRSGEGYENVIPEERPHVAYFHTDTGIPCFIFEKPYTHEYSEQEFCDKFKNEWDDTHYNPRYDDDCHDPVDYADYDMELADKPRNAYLNYQAAVFRFKQICQGLKVNAAKDLKEE